MYSKADCKQNVSSSAVENYLAVKMLILDTIFFASSKNHSN